MVGPDAEARALVRHAGRLFVAGANLTVPHGTVVLRKGYGLGAMAMGGGGFKTGLFAVSWPTGEFGGMNLEGAVRLGYRRELDAIEDPAEREEFAAAKLAGMIDRGKALNAATYFEFDDVIDPADTRRWITAAFAAAPTPAPARRKSAPTPTPGEPSRPFMDASGQPLEGGSEVGGERETAGPRRPRAQTDRRLQKPRPWPSRDRGDLEASSDAGRRPYWSVTEPAGDGKSSNAGWGARLREGRLDARRHTV